MSEIKFVDVSKIYQRRETDVVALKSINLTVKDKEFVSLVGPSGCGKTTLLMMAAGLQAPSSGSVTAGDRAVVGPGPERAVVFQQFALFPWKTVWDNIDFGLKCKRVDRATRAEAITHYIGLMGLSGHEHAYPHQLSGGMQQRVALARSYVLKPEVLLMDEPFGALDAQTRMEMQAELLHITRGEPRTTVFVTHSVEEAVFLSDRVVVLSARPGVIRTIIDITEIRKRESWLERPIESVLATSVFNELKRQVWEVLNDRIVPGMAVHHTPA
jgi:NitT/TauT family transport system ATP-binding protein